MLWLGIILLLSLAAYWAGERLHVPRGTLLVLVGILFGPQVLDLPLANGAEHFSLITLMALAMVGFLLGERLYWKALRRGTSALVIGSVATLVTTLVVSVTVWLATGDLAAALILGAIAPATAPVATLDVLHEAGAQGRLTRVLTQIVAIDDVWTAVLFTLLLVAAEISLGASVQLSEIAAGLLELGGAVLLGVLLGLPMAWLTGRLSQGEPSILEAAGFVFLAAGLASWLGLSYLLTCIVMGAVVANVAKHHVRPFRSIKGIADPFMFVFFFLAGFQLELSA
ncbi:MAG: sodium:proton exchanger, partial [Halomonadaceae bacterium]